MSIADSKRAVFEELVATEELSLRREDAGAAGCLGCRLNRPNSLLLDDCLDRPVLDESWVSADDWVLLMTLLRLVKLLPSSCCCS